MSRSLLRSVLAVCVVLVPGLSPPADGQTTISWANPVDGNWSESSKWSPNNVPDSTSENAVLGLTGPYSVYLDNPYSIRSLSITNPEATLFVRYGRTLTISKTGAAISGTIVVDHENTNWLTQVLFAHDAVVSGTGRITLRHRDYSRLGTTNNNTDSASLGAGIVIDGTGSITGTFYSEASIEGGGTYPGPIINGRVYQNGPGRVYVGVAGRHAAIGSGLLTGGRIETANGGLFSAIGSPSTIDGVWIAPASSVFVQGAATLRVLSGGVVNDGVVVIHPDAANGFASFFELSLGSIVSGQGTIAMRDISRATISTSGANTDLATVAVGQTIAGTGVIAGNIHCDGTIAPGESIGRIDCLGGISMGATGVIEIDLASATSRDSIRGSGGLHLGGKLRVRYLNNYQLPLNQKYTMISVGTLSGRFSSFELPQTSGRLGVRYIGNTVVLHTCCSADFNLDGFVNGDDYDAFAELFDTADPDADFNADGFVNGNDYDEFADHYDQGC